MRVASVPIPRRKILAHHKKLGALYGALIKRILMLHPGECFFLSNRLPPDHPCYDWRAAKDIQTQAWRCAKRHGVKIVTRDADLCGIMGVRIWRVG